MNVCSSRYRFDFFAFFFVFEGLAATAAAAFLPPFAKAFSQPVA